MLNNKRVAIVLPAYNAAKTLEQTYNEIPFEIVDDVILVDDCSNDETKTVAERLHIDTLIHARNLGYGGNQKTCYREALKRSADIIVMLHPDYQYTPKLVAALAAMIAYETYDAAIGSRILAQSAIAGGMPRYKYIANRLLTFIQNIALQQKLSEYHTGFRAFSRKVLESLPLEENSNDFIFDDQMLTQIIFAGFRIGEISCPTRYTAESSSIGFLRSLRYGIGVLLVSVQFVLQKHCGFQFKIFSSNGTRLCP